MERRNRKSLRYERMFLEFSSSVEMWMKRAIFGLFVLLVLFQLLLRSPEMRRWLTWVDSNEGAPLYQSETLR